MVYKNSGLITLFKMRNILIRKGTTKDLSEVLKLIKALAEFEKAPQKVTNSLEQMKKEAHLFHFFVAEKGSEVIGFALYFFAYYTWVGKSMYLDDLYVKPEFRGNQVGLHLLKNVFKTAKRENCKRLRWSVLDWNKPAVDFYKRVGAEISGEWLTCDVHSATLDRFIKSKP